MAVNDIYSKRQKKLRGETPDILVYDELPEALRIQIVHIIKDAFGYDRRGYNTIGEPAEAYKEVHKTLCREYGVFRLGNTKESDEVCIFNYFLKTNDIEKAMDVIELSFKIISNYIKENFQKYTFNTEICIKPDDAINELNIRFKEHGVGYQFESGEIIRVDSTIIHSEITKPVLSLLNNNKFIGANEEYLKAHDHYRHGRNKECLTECLKAFESTLKVICNKKGWTYNQTDTSKRLIQICFQNGIVPSFTQNQFTSLQNLLESGIPAIRNKLGGHGQGAVLQNVDDDITRYGLNLTGSNIIFLVELSGIK